MQRASPSTGQPIFAQATAKRARPFTLATVHQAAPGATAFQGHLSPATPRIAAMPMPPCRMQPRCRHLGLPPCLPRSQSGLHGRCQTQQVKLRQVWQRGGYSALPPWSRTLNSWLQTLATLPPYCRIQALCAVLSAARTIRAVRALPVPAGWGLLGMLGKKQLLRLSLFTGR